MKRLVLLLILTSFCLTGLAQAPTGTQRIVLTTNYDSREAAMDALVEEILPMLNLTPCWIEHTYGLVNVEDEQATTTLTRMMYYFKAYKDGSIEVSGKFLAYSIEKYPERIEMGGMRGSMKEKTFKEMEQLALSIPHNEVFYK